MVVFDVNWFAVVIAAVVAMAIGAAWYSKSLFGKSWAKEMGISDSRLKNMQKNMGRTYGVAFVGWLIMAFVLANAMTAFAAVTIASAVVLAFWLWLGFMLPLMVGTILWEGKSQRLLSINASYNLVALVAMAIVIVLFV